MITGASLGIGLATAASVATVVADVIVFLASPRAHWINGLNIPAGGLEQTFPAPGRRPY